MAAAVKIQALRRGHAGRVEAAKQQAASPIIRRFVSQEQTTRSQTFTSTYVRPMLSSTKFNGLLVSGYSAELASLRLPSGDFGRGDDGTVIPEGVPPSPSPKSRGGAVGGVRRKKKRSGGMFSCGAPAVCAADMKTAGGGDRIPTPTAAAAAAEAASAAAASAPTRSSPSIHGIDPAGLRQAIDAMKVSELLSVVEAAATAMSKDRLNEAFDSDDRKAAIAEAVLAER